MMMEEGKSESILDLGISLEDLKQFEQSKVWKWLLGEIEVQIAQLHMEGELLDDFALVKRNQGKIASLRGIVSLVSVLRTEIESELLEEAEEDGRTS